MKNRILWGLVALFGIGCVAEGAFILETGRAGTASAAVTPFRGQGNDVDRWERRISGELQREGRIEEGEFDRIFDDEFFGRRLDPFAEIAKVQRRMESQLMGRDRELFGSAFKSWFDKRVELGGIRSRTEDHGTTVAVTYEIPGLNTGSVKVDVSSGRIRMAFDAKKRETKGGISTETTESFEKVMPIPDGVDSRDFQVKKGKDELALVFRKETPQPSRS